MSIFICYSNKDSNFALQMRQKLLSNDIDVWLDQTSITPGQNWQESIENAIKSCSHMIFLLSRHSLDSKEVEAEWGLALNLGKTIIPVILDNSPLPYRLNSIQGLSVSRYGFDAVVRRLIRILPIQQLPKHMLAKDSIKEIPREYATLILRLARSEYRNILVRTEAYSTFGELLDDVFIHYLSDIVSPYSYGSEWVLSGEPFDTLILVPWTWVQQPGQSISKLAPDWAGTIAPAELTIRPGSYWEIKLKESMVKQPYAVATNKDKVMRLLLSDAKAISAIYGEGLLVKKHFDQVDQTDYNYSFVFRDWLRMDLTGTLLVDSGKEFPIELEKRFARRMR